MMFRKETEFQETEIGKIPKDWKIEKLSSLATIIMGQSPPSSTYNREGKGLPFIQGKMEFRRMYPSPTMYTSRPLKIAEEGDILMSVRAPVGDVNIAPYKLCIGRGLAAVRFNSKVANNLFYFYYLQSIKSRLENLGKGSTFKAITKKDLEELRIVYPPLNEQKGVADILLMVDRGIEIVDKTVAKLERIKRALLNELLTGRIRVKEDDGKLTFYKETEFQDTEIGEIPKEWEVVSLEDVSLTIRTGPFGSQLKKSELSESGIKVYTQENVLKNDFSLGNLYISYNKFEQLKNMEIKPGDVLLTIRGSIGYSAVFPEGAERGIIHTNLAYIRVKIGLLSPKYLSLLINYHSSIKSQLITLSSATTLGALYAKNIKKIKIPLPPLHEQQKIVEILSMIDKAIELYRREKERFLHLRRGLMGVLLTGRVRVVSDVRDVGVVV